MMNNAGLYIHIPFCKTKCPYCDFYSITDLSLISRWLEAFRREVEFYREHFSAFDTLFIGGGTPSLLPEPVLDAMMTTIRTAWSLPHDAEVTLEANPDDITDGKTAFYRSIGINRISLGVQSLDDATLSFLKRRHNSDGAKHAINTIRRYFDNFNIDLIWGFPDQKEEEWIATLKEALLFQPTHLSCYQLTVEPHTPLGHIKAQGRLKSPTEKQEERLFLATSGFLEKQGYIHYEVSNFAKTESRACRHNLKYWNRVPYLGLGPGAHSFNGGERWWNHRSVTEYYENLVRDTTPVKDRETISSEQVRIEKLGLGLRTHRGISLSDLGRGSSVTTNLQLLVKQGRIMVCDERIIPTQRGFLVADRLALMLYD